MTRINNITQYYSGRSSRDVEFNEFMTSYGVGIDLTFNDESGMNWSGRSANWKPEKCPGGRNEGKTGHAQKILQCQGPVQPFLAWAFAGYITPVEPSQSAFMWRFGLVARSTYSTTAAIERLPPKLRPRDSLTSINNGAREEKGKTCPEVPGSDITNQ
ncbi:hypothetical protein PCH_Pc22g05570 [Penicillium rubens Wisconsin 54-1255]|uniref:Uncharacterized protein n=1 Tax=Penicillium rubens (strain ATCC 28089 / DSM 1075 / NRRL 1951 / Wisconsin 54-1255) TaxID=500485 RepID=B6HUU1_PENRW|nr:hypothetical protein PCH_Pc22g05570 [Penicillium rubens Wisconsin 54-1255]